MVTYVLARNVTTGPLVVAPDGSMLGGGEWGAVNADAPEVKALPAEALMVWDTLPSGDGWDTDAQAAIDEVREANRSAKAPKSGAAEAPTTSTSAASPSPKRGS